MQSEFVIFMQFFLTGLSMGSIYALVALGFVLIYKSTSILNLAQGEFLMVGAYCLPFDDTRLRPEFYCFLCVDDGVFGAAGVWRWNGSCCDP